MYISRLQGEYGQKAPGVAASADVQLLSIYLSVYLSMYIYIYIYIYMYIYI